MAEYVELYIDQGTDFSTVIYINDDNSNIPQDLTNYTVSSMLKKSLVSVSATDSFVCSVSNPSAGEITIGMSASNTANIPAGTYFYDVKLTSNTLSKSKLIEGVVFVSPTITR